MQDQNSLKDINTLKIKQVMKKISIASKSEIARETKLSFPTVTRILEQLCSSGEIIETGETHKTAGRSASMFTINPLFSLSLLIRIEGNKISWKIKDMNNLTIEQQKFVSKKNLLDDLDQIITESQLKYPSLKAIVIGIAAMILEGAVKETFFSQDLKGINIPVHFQNITTLPIQIENDMNAVVMGQWHQSRIKPDSSVGIYCNEGCMGAGVVLNGDVWHGATNFAGELSFLPANKTATKQSDQNSIFEQYVNIIQIYTTIINPHQIILYSNSDICEIINEIRTRCWDLLPHNALPHIELSDNFETDYETGLFAIAQKLIS